MTGPRQWWDALSDVKKAMGIGVTLGSGAVTMALSLMGYIGLPEEIARQDQHLKIHDLQIDSLRVAGEGRDRRIDATDWRMDYTICLLEALSGEGRRTSTQCSADFATGRP